MSDPSSPSAADQPSAPKLPVLGSMTGSSNAIRIVLRVPPGSTTASARTIDGGWPSSMIHVFSAGSVPTDPPPMLSMVVSSILISPVALGDAVVGAKVSVCRAVSFPSKLVTIRVSPSAWNCG